MCTGIALALSDIPLKVVEVHRLEDRIFKRGGEFEVRFFFNDAERYLPVWYEGQFRIMPWGSNRRESRRLPVGGWIASDRLKSNSWGDAEIISAMIPAALGFEKGIWFRVRQGIRGMVMKNERNQDVAYMLCEKSSHYFRVMTRSPRMPLLIDEKI